MRFQKSNLLGVYPITGKSEASQNLPNTGILTTHEK